MAEISSIWSLLVEKPLVISILKYHLVHLEQELMNIPEEESQADIEMTSKKLTDLVTQFEIFDQSTIISYERRKGS